MKPIHTCIELTRDESATFDRLPQVEDVGRNFWKKVLNARGIKYPTEASYCSIDSTPWRGIYFVHISSRVKCSTRPLEFAN